jgi:hypothetical protein
MSTEIVERVAHIALGVVLLIGLAQLYQLAPSNGNFRGSQAQKRESNQRRPIADRL